MNTCAQCQAEHNRRSDYCSGECRKQAIADGRLTPDPVQSARVSYGKRKAMWEQELLHNAPPHIQQGPARVRRRWLRTQPELPADLVKPIERSALSRGIQALIANTELYERIGREGVADMLNCSVSYVCKLEGEHRREQMRARLQADVDFDPTPYRRLLEGAGEFAFED